MTDIASRLRRDDSGFSLVELLVAILLTGTIMTLAVFMFAGGTRNTSLAQSIDSGTREASNGMNQISRMIRVASPNPLADPKPGETSVEPAVRVAAPDELSLYAYVNLEGDERPAIVRYSVDDEGRLIEEQWKALSATADSNGHWEFPSTATPAGVTRVLCSFLAKGDRLFRYRDVHGAEIVPAGAVGAGSIDAIRAIEITITIVPSGDSSAVTLQNTVTMANVGKSS